MARLYADEQYPYPVVEYLRALGHNVLTVQEAGKANQKVPDSEVLAFATIEQRAVVTQNRKDFVSSPIMPGLSPAPTIVAGKPWQTE
jgi:predicted nuclease of predicted toxin-antitoxin system